KLFIYICDSGGSVKLSVLLKQSSPLASRKSELGAKNWLMSQAYPCLVVVKDFNGEIAGFMQENCHGKCNHSNNF
ncbi:unnamed protein product, partial [Porites lobata]